MIRLCRCLWLVMRIRLLCLCVSMLCMVLCGCVVCMSRGCL